MKTRIATFALIVFSLAFAGFAADTPKSCPKDKAAACCKADADCCKDAADCCKDKASCCDKADGRQKTCCKKNGCDMHEKKS